MSELDLKHFIYTHTFGVLSTHSEAEAGYPFGSITPYIVTPDGDLAILISHLAEHTHNISADPKVSLTIFDIKDDTNPSTGPRITCLADANLAQDQSMLNNLYLEKFPDAEMLLNLPGFNFYTLKVKKIRLVAGFGKVKWITSEQLSL